MQARKATERLYIQRILTPEIQVRFSQIKPLSFFLKTNFKDRKKYTDPLIDMHFHNSLRSGEAIKASTTQANWKPTYA